MATKKGRVVEWMSINNSLDGKDADDRKWFTLPVNAPSSQPPRIIENGVREGQSAKSGGTPFQWFFQFKK